MDDIVLLSEVSSANTEEIGMKAANLADLKARDYPVSPAVIITGNLFVKFIEITGLKDKIAEFLNSNQDIKTKSTEIQKIIMNSVIPEDMANFIYENYMSLSIDTSTERMITSSPEPYVALRVSSTSEKIIDNSFLNIKGKERLINGIKACWASVFTQQNLELRRFKPSIIVQKMVNSKKSGYIYTTNPKTNNPNEIMIEICSGLGNGLSLKQIKPSKYYVSKEEFEVRNSELFEQTSQYTLDMSQERTVKLNLDEPLRNIVDEFIIRELAKIGKKVELNFDRPHKIIFAIDKQIQILGKEPIIAEPISVPKEESNSNVEGMPLQKNNVDNTIVNKNINQSVNENYSNNQSNINQQNNDISNNNQDINDTETKDNVIITEHDTQKDYTDEQIKHGENLVENILNDKVSNLEDKNIPKEHTQVQKSLNQPFDYEKSVEVSEDSLELYDEELFDEIEKIDINPNHTNKDISELNKDEKVEIDSKKNNINNQTNDNEKKSFLNQYINQNPSKIYLKAISVSSGQFIITCDQAIFAALKSKYKTVFSRESHNYFNEIVNELKAHTNVPYENSIKNIHKIRDLILAKFYEPTPSDLSMALEYTNKFLEEF